MSRALIVSKSEKAIAFLNDMLKQDRYDDIYICESCTEARRTIAEQDFEICIIDVPLRDEPGSELAIQIAEDWPECQVILLIKADFFEEVTERMEEYGILTVAKPISQTLLWTAIKMTGAVRVRMRKIRKENTKLLQRIEDIRMINRAKLTLMTYLNMSEAEAHRYIEKQAMDLRITKREVAERVLKTYKN